MIKRSKMSHEQAGLAVEKGAFSSDVTEAADAVALILTQGWCPQWTFMNMSLKGLRNGPEDLDLAIITYEYDKSPLFHEFMAFKENTYRNWEVPYVRLYRKGRFISDGNAMAASRMIEALRKG